MNSCISPKDFQIAESFFDKLIHDWRNSLAVIHVGADILHKSVDNPQLNLIIDNIQQEINFINHFINYSLIGLSNNFFNLINNCNQPKKYSIKLCLAEIINQFPFKNNNQQKICQQLLDFKDFLVCIDKQLLVILLNNLLKIVIANIDNFNLVKLKIIMKKDKLIIINYLHNTNKQLTNQFNKNNFNQLPIKLKNNIQINWYCCYNIMRKIGGDLTVKLANNQQIICLEF